MPNVEIRATLASRLDHLFRTIRPDGRAEYSYEEVAAGIRATGIMISHTYVWQLRKGIRDNPTMRHIEALADFFGVRPAYFFDDAVAAATDEQLALLAAVRDSGVRSIALRAAGLSPNGLRAILGMVEHAREVEGLEG